MSDAAAPQSSTAAAPKLDANDVARDTGAAGLAAALDGATAAAVERKTLRNFRLELNEAGKGERRKPKEIRRAVPLLEISKDLQELTGGWPKRVAALPFVKQGGAARLLPDMDCLFAWIGEGFELCWGHGQDEGNVNLTPKAEFYAHLAQGPTVESFRAVEDWPHEPPLKGHFYTWDPPAGYAPAGAHLAGLLAFFDNAETDLDAVLLKAMFVTPAWGGPYGARPAFVLEAPDRGCGKSTLADVVGLLFGGALEFDLTKKGEEDLATRLLSPGGLTKRVVRMDNIKKTVASGVLEGLVTALDISGKVLFKGEGCRPNVLTWILTANGTVLSRDMAERCIIIRLRRPTMRPGWREEVMYYATERRAFILADILDALKAPPAEVTIADRWADWTRNVLARCTADPAAVSRAVGLNQERRAARDDDAEEAQAIQEALDKDLRENVPATAGFLTETGAVFRTAGEMAMIVNTALGLNMTPRKVGHVLAGHVEAGRLERLQRARTDAAKGWRLWPKPPDPEPTPAGPVAPPPPAVSAAPAPEAPC